MSRQLLLPVTLGPALKKLTGEGRLCSRVWIAREGTRWAVYFHLDGSRDGYYIGKARGGKRLWTQNWRCIQWIETYLPEVDAIEIYLRKPRSHSA